MKTDITIKKEQTINTGNYSSIRPCVSLTVSDVDVDKIQKVYENMNIITAALFLNEIEILSELQESIRNNGLKSFLSSLEDEQMKEDFEKAVKELTDDSFLI